MGKKLKKEENSAEYITQVLEKFDFGDFVYDDVLEEMRGTLLMPFMNEIEKNEDNHLNIAARIKRLAASEKIKKTIPELQSVIKRIGIPEDKNGLALFCTLFMDIFLLGWIHKRFPQSNKKIRMGSFIIGLVHFGSSVIQAQKATAKWYGQKSPTSARNAYYYVQSSPRMDEPSILEENYSIFIDGPKIKFISDNNKTNIAFEKLKKACFAHHKKEKIRLNRKRIKAL